MKARFAAPILILAVLLSPRAHAGKVELGESDNKVTKAGVITLSADWLKDKGKKYDIAFRMKNEHKTGIIVRLDDMRCYRGETEGVLKHTFFNVGERTIDMRPGQLKKFTMVCHVGDKSVGTYRIVVGHVYENASGDGRSLGKALAQDVTWQVTIAN